MHMYTESLGLVTPAFKVQLILLFNFKHIALACSYTKVKLPFYFKEEKVQINRFPIHV